MHQSDGERIRVLFMQTQTYFGADSRIHALIMEHLDPAAFEVHVACNHGRGDSPALDALRGIKNLRVRPTDFGPTLDTGSKWAALSDGLRNADFLFDIAGLAQYARHHRIQIVHGTEKPRDVLYGRAVASACSAKTVTHLHIKMGNWIRPAARRMMRMSDRILGVSRWTADTAVSFGYPREQVDHVLNALDATRWNPEGVDGSEVRTQFGVHDDTPIVSIIARVFPWKGHELLVHALAAVRDRGIPFKLLIVGEDDPRATPGGGLHTSDLRAAIDRHKLDAHVAFTGFRSDIPEILAASDVFALPSFEEPFGVAYLEAMAMKVPVIALRSGGVTEFLEHGHTALLSAPGDVAQLADNLSALLRNPTLRRQMGEAGRRLVLSRFTPQRLGRDMAQFYRGLLGVPARAQVGLPEVGLPGGVTLQA